MSGAIDTSSIAAGGCHDIRAIVETREMRRGNRHRIIWLRHASFIHVYSYARRTLLHECSLQQSLFMYVC